MMGSTELFDDVKWELSIAGHKKRPVARRAGQEEGGKVGGANRHQTYWMNDCFNHYQTLYLSYMYL